jgi:hypothetical protein
MARYSELVRAEGKKSQPVPAALLYLVAAILWALLLRLFPAGMLDMIRDPWLADNTRLREVLVYPPHLNSRQALESFIAARLQSQFQTLSRSFVSTLPKGNLFGKPKTNAASRAVCEFTTSAACAAQEIWPV